MPYDALFDRSAPGGSVGGTSSTNATAVGDRSLTRWSALARWRPLPTTARAGRDTEIRAECFRRMVEPLLERGVTRLIIESREGRDDLDRQVLIDQLRSPSRRRLRIRPPASARRSTAVDRGRPGLVLLSRRFLARTHQRDHYCGGYNGHVESARPDRSPSGEEPGSLPEAQRNRHLKEYPVIGLVVTGRAGRQDLELISEAPSHGRGLPPYSRGTWSAPGKSAESPQKVRRTSKTDQRWPTRTNT